MDADREHREVPLSDTVKQSLDKLKPHAGSWGQLHTALATAYHQPYKRHPEPKMDSTSTQHRHRERRWTVDGWFVVVDLRNNVVVFAGRQSGGAQS